MPSMVLFYVIMAPLLAWWTTKLARSKGRQMPWLWGFAAFFLTMPPEPWRLLGMIPLLVLIFLKAPQAQVDSPPKETICPKCQSSHSASQRYCISCGWELGRAYPESGIAAEQPAQTPQESGTDPIAPEPVMASEAATVGDAPAEPAAAEPAVETVTAAETTVEPQPEAPVYRGPPTAAGMTERGINLFNLGRTQEAIDQFTKAIALDPNFKEAWERRAEAYGNLGRDGEAAEDRRHLNTINPGSSTG